VDSTVINLFTSVMSKSISLHLLSHYKNIYFLVT